MIMLWIILGTCDKLASLCKCWRYGRALWHNWHYPLCTYGEGRRGRSCLPEWRGRSQVLCFVYLSYNYAMIVVFYLYIFNNLLFNYHTYSITNSITFIGQLKCSITVSWMGNQCVYRCAKKFQFFLPPCNPQKQRPSQSWRLQGEVALRLA